MTSRRALGIVLACALALLPACGGSGGGGLSVPAGPGAVTVLSDSTCPSGPGTLPNTTCAHVRVEVSGLPPIEAELRIFDPPAGVTPIGTVIVGTGNLGIGFYGDLGNAADLLQQLADAGFRVVDRRWTTGWFASGGGVRPQSARYATLLTWVHDTLHTAGAFCATGNSAGSAEVAYALTDWNAEQILDVAVFSGGPPFSRLEYLCESPVPPAWAAQCAAIVPPATLTCGTSSCNTNEPSVCDPIVGSPLPAGLDEDGLLHTGADLDHPGVVLRFLFGTDDCTAAVPFGLLFRDALTDVSTLDFVPGAPHFVATTPEGRDAIAQALITSVTGVPAPSSMHVEGRLELGGARYTLLLESSAQGSKAVRVVESREPAD